MNKIMRGIMDFFYPQNVTCIVCDEELREGDDRLRSVCRSCRDGLEQLPSLKTMILGGEEREVYSVFCYDETAREMTLAYKDGNRPYLARYIASFMFDVYKNSGLKADVLVYVPSDKATVRRRGYDAMGLVAKAFAGLAELPIVDAITKAEGGVDLSVVPREERADALKGVYLPAGTELSGKDVLLIDDVVTSGATLNECAFALKKDHADSIVCLTFCRAEKR